MGQTGVSGQIGASGSSPTSSVDRMSSNDSRCSGVSRSNTRRRTSPTCPGAAFSTTAMPSSVRDAMIARRSSGCRLRITQPFAWSLLTACDIRLGDARTTEASSVMVSERPGASDSIARIR